MLQSVSCSVLMDVCGLLLVSRIRSFLETGFPGCRVRHPLCSKKILVRPWLECVVACIVCTWQCVAVCMMQCVADCWLHCVDGC